MQLHRLVALALVPQVVGVFMVAKTMAQSTPSEFAELSLLELFEQTIDDTGSSGPKSPWTFAYQYRFAEFEGYLDGTKSLSFQDVLWNGPGEQRTAKNFPIVPTRITQSVHTVGVGYQLDDNWQLYLSVPYIRQESDHISIVRDYDFFVIETHGMGDTSVSASYRWNDAAEHIWQFSFGLTLPTGSIDEVGDTPRAPGNQQLPYTMQLGSGTYDIPLELSYQHSELQNIDVRLSANIRTGRNDRSYRLGNNYTLSSRYQFHLSPTIQSFAGVNVQYSESIHGQDDSLLVNAAFPYPAAITNPDLYGGTKVNVRLGLLWQFSQANRLNIEVGKPVYQDLNGPQPKEQWRSSIQISRAL
ncbi:MAG: hypothetical protein ACNA7T_06640 [Haliea sp.]|jgi:hypothetical protein